MFLRDTKQDVTGNNTKNWKETTTLALECNRNHLSQQLPI